MTQNTTTVTKKQIETAYNALDILNNRNWTNHRDACHKQTKADTRSDAGRARAVVVKRIAEFIGGTMKMPQTRDYLHCQPGAFYAAALAEEYRDEIIKAWKEAGIDAQELAAADIDATKF